MAVCLETELVEGEVNNMKQLQLITLVMVILALFSACGSEAITDIGKEKADIHINMYEPLVDSDEQIHMTEANNELETQCGDSTKTNVLDGINVNDLLFKSLDEVVAILGPYYIESHFNEIAGIYYEGSCRIGYIEVCGHDNGIQTRSEAEVVGMEVYQEIDIYKGISVGKTLDEINGNPELMNPLKLTGDAGDGKVLASGQYEYNNNFIITYLSFSEDMVCEYVYLKREEEKNPDYVEL